MRNIQFCSAVFVLSLLAACGDSGSGGSAAGGQASEGGSPAEGGGGSGQGGNGTLSCGDGVVDDGEACDNGDANADTAACTTTCEDAACGDGLLLAGGEECDDGANNSDTGACTSGCAIAACGDGFVEAGVEECDDGDDNGDDAACLASCNAATCGDGLVQAGEEECDQGDDNADTGACTSACVTASCGDGLVQASVEACDDGNQNDNDSCTNDCALASCGDGIVQAPEACDLGNANSNTGACTLACLLPICGDGFVQPGEQCDLGGGNNNNGVCTLGCDNAVCGDGLTHTGIEPCDDGNAVQGDGCNNNCVVSATVQWTQTYTNAAGGALWQGVTTDAAGNVYVVGSQETAAQGLNFVARKYTAAGTVVWTQTLSGAANLDDQGLAVTLDATGNVVVLGYETLANGTTNMLVAKLSGTNGSLVWSYSYDGGLGGNDYGFGITANAAGDLLVTGQVENNATQGLNTLVAKLAGINGTVVWADFANGLSNADDGGNAITLDAAGNILVAGFVRNSTTDDIWLRKYTDTGVSFTTVWTRTYNGTGNDIDSAFAVAADGSNNVVLAGFESTAAQGANAFIRKYNSNGDVLWTQTNSGAAGLNDVAYGVDIDASGAVVVGGFISVANDTADVWTRKYSATGSTMWTTTFNGSADIDDVGYALATDASANVLVAGREVANGPIVNAWLRKYAP